MTDSLPLSDDETARARRYLPHALVATALVAVLPVAVVWGLRADGMVSSPWLCLGITVVLSLGASLIGNRYWRRRPGSGDLLFSELLLWGWLRRVRIERQLDSASRRLGLMPSAGHGDDGDDLPLPQGTLELLSQLAAAMEAHDPYIDGHSRRVARHATGVARGLGLPPEDVSKIAGAAAVHDVGKLRLPREILMKAGKLTDEEFEVIKRHSTEGAQMVACLGDPELTAIVRHHHERIDGSGYPAGLHGGEIPLGARIIAVADTFDAITSARPYRPAARHQQALDIIEREAGTQLDPDVVHAFINYYSGRRVLAAWSVLGALPQRLLNWFHRLPGAPPVTGAQAVGATAATLAVTAAAVVPPTVFIRPAHRPPAPASGQLRALASASGSAELVARAGIRVGAQVGSAATRGLGAGHTRSGARHPRPRATTFFASLTPLGTAVNAGRTTGAGAPAAAVGSTPPAGPSPSGAPAPGGSPGPSAATGTGAPTTVFVVVSPAPTSGPPAPVPAPTPVPVVAQVSSSPPSTVPASPTPTSSSSTPSSAGTGTSTGGGTPTGSQGGGTPTGSQGGGTPTPGGGTPPPPPPPPPPAVMPTSVAQCMHDAWNQFGTFGNEAQCGDYVLHGTLPAAKTN